MNRPTPTPPRRGALSLPLLGGVGVGSELPCAREVWGGLSLRGTSAERTEKRGNPSQPAFSPPVPSPPSDGREGEVLARPHSGMRPSSLCLQTLCCGERSNVSKIRLCVCVRQPLVHCSAPWRCLRSRFLSWHRRCVSSTAISGVDTAKATPSLPATVRRRPNHAKKATTLPLRRPPRLARP